MLTEKDIIDAECLKTHSLYTPPEGKFIPFVITKHIHPLTAVKQDNPIFGIYIHKGIVKTLKSFLDTFDRDKSGLDYESWQLTGDIYLPKIV